MSLPQECNQYTYADYVTWGDSQRRELIDGVPYAMVPAPSMKHQAVSWELSRQIAIYLKGKSCKAFAAPFDVRLTIDNGDDTVVQPDLLVVCDPSKLDNNGCHGSPDMIIEILSPGTAKRDRLVKFQLYQRTGVKEYWIVDPETKTVQACILKEGEYVVTMYGETDVAPVHVLEKFSIDLSDVFHSIG